MHTGFGPPAVSLEAPSRWTAMAACACAVHCLLTPLIATALPFLAVSESSEWWALGITLVLGGSVTFLGPARRRAPVLLLLGLGTAIWTASLLGLLEPLPEHLISPAGSLVFAAGMLWSARICRAGACERCELPPG